MQCSRSIEEPEQGSRRQLRHQNNKLLVFFEKLPQVLIYFQSVVLQIICILNNFPSKGWWSDRTRNSHESHVGASPLLSLFQLGNHDCFAVDLDQQVVCPDCLVGVLPIELGNTTVVSDFYYAPVTCRKP
eukprot:TRINITY_DN6012_c0_g1_i4.p1 TRINITY_DN6012_c0_g1~~TRINITY_DN6012_c0_g1_i4.p1  ORF type:complete len:130 (+),score=7.92 TRINITY_DN6012_c0_g1_i4:48-437(+)